jgi:hypothetical protein
MTLLANPMNSEFFSHCAPVFVHAKQQLDVGFVQDAVESRNFSSIFYPGVTQRDLSTRKALKENPPSH